MTTKMIEHRNSFWYTYDPSLVTNLLKRVILILSFSVIKQHTPVQSTVLELNPLPKYIFHSSVIAFLLTEESNDISSIDQLVKL